MALAIALATPATGNAATEDATVKAELVKPVALAKVTGMNFGTLMTDGSAGQVSLSPSGEITSQGGVAVADRKRADPGTFKMIGDRSQAYTITFPTAATFANGDDIIKVGAFTHDAGATPLLGGDGRGGFNIGATLTLGKGQPTGTYGGAVSVIVSNN